MADRIFKGKLVPVQDAAFPEASCDFHKPHKGGLVPFEVLYQILRSVETEQRSPRGNFLHIQLVGESLWVSGNNDEWIKIDPDGSFEIGTSGV